VDIDIWNTDTKDFNTAFLTFDTGATVTTISNTILEALGYDVSKGKEQKITTGSGVAIVREITVDALRIGINYTLENVKVYAHKFPDESFSTGVLGLNVISQFDILLGFSNRLINLSKIPE
jgi:predicted aspartyl protease